uniref:NAD(P)H-hydrate dehydratase n=1 Tax=Pedobacter sp. TaxID=1411316 RepID=UPI003D7FCF5F
ISSIDLMERAAEAFVAAFLRDELKKDISITIFCGKGNNGGDGLAIGRLLLHKGYKQIKLIVADFNDKQSNDYLTNLQRLQDLPLEVEHINEPEVIKNLNTTIIIDALIGSGLNKPLTGKMEALVSLINGLNKVVYAVDVPTGFFTEGQLPHEYKGVVAYKTICFQRPKINFFFPESAKATEKFEVVNIGLDENFIQNQASAFSLIENADIKNLFKPRKAFSHKGTYGHALILAGEKQTMGAALLNAKACLYAGAGLTTLCIPESGLNTLNTSLPEVMYVDRERVFQQADKYNAIAVGSGLGTSPEAKDLVEKLLHLKKALVIDADALNLLANHQELQDLVSPGSILTPHLKEFDHLFGKHDSWHERLMTARKQAMKLQSVIVLKNQYTFIVASDGMVYINPTGNPGMAQGGMGDVLTGMITAYLAQGLTPEHAAVVACYFHGKSGDDLAVDHFNMTASQVAENLPLVVRHMLG